MLDVQKRISRVYEQIDGGGHQGGEAEKSGEERSCKLTGRKEEEEEDTTKAKLEDKCR